MGVPTYLYRRRPDGTVESRLFDSDALPEDEDWTDSPANLAFANTMGATASAPLANALQPDRSAADRPPRDRPAKRSDRPSAGLRRLLRRSARRASAKRSSPPGAKR